MSHCCTVSNDSELLHVGQYGGAPLGHVAKKTKTSSFITTDIKHKLYVSTATNIPQFFRATARSAERVLAIAILSVRPSVCRVSTRDSSYCQLAKRVVLSVCLSVTTRYRFTPRWDRDSGFSPYDSLESLVSCGQISCCLVRRFPSNDGIKNRYPRKKSLFCTIN